MRVFTTTAALQMGKLFNHHSLAEKTRIGLEIILQPSEVSMNRNRYHHPGPDPGAGGFTAELSFSLTVFDENKNCAAGLGRAG